MNRLGAALPTALLGALAAVVLLAFFYVAGGALRIDFAVDPPRLMSGVYPAERDQATGLTFAWTGADVALRVPGLDRRVPWTAEIRLRGGRQKPADNPEVVFFVDGVRTLAHQSEAAFTVVTMSIPPRAERPRGLLLTMQSSSTFVPGPADPRPLGVMLDAITLSPGGYALPPRDALAGTATAGATLGAAIALVGVTPGLAIGAAVVLAAAQSAVLARGFGPFTDFQDTVTRVAMATGASLVLIVFALERIRGRSLRNTARFAAAFTAAALFLKLLVLLHPEMPIGDALFQAHRFQEVLRGNYYFTSTAPGNYLFPYAPGLYVAASPFADFVRREAGDVILLRTVVAATDAVVGASLYAVVAKWWGDRRAAAFTCALYQILPLDFLIATGGTLTNAFAQSLAVGVLAIASAPWVRLDRIVGLAVLTLAMLAAFLSHTSTFAILSVTGAVVGLMLLWRGGRDLRSPGLAVGAATAAAVVLAVIVYYAHFMDTYRTELSRIGAETAAAAADAGGRSLTDRARVVPFYLNSYYGIPSLILAVAGAAQLWRRAARDRLTLTVAGWAASCGVFLLIGVLTPVDMRYYVAALPAVATAAAAGASYWWAVGGRRRVIAAALLAWAIGLGIKTWWNVLA